MRLRTWVRRQGAGAIQRLHEQTGISRQAISNLVNGKSVASYPTAKLISAATGGAVSVDELQREPRKQQRAA